MQGPHAHSWSHRRRVSKLNELSSNGKKENCIQAPGKTQVSHRDCGLRGMGYCLKCILTSEPPTLFAASSSWFVPLSPDEGTKRTKGWAKKPGIYPCSLRRFWWGRSHWAWTPPPRENMGHSFPYPELRPVLEEGGTEVGNGQDSIAPTTVWSRISTSPLRTDFPTRLISTEVSYIPPRASHCSNIIGTIPFVLTAKAWGSMAGLQIYGPKTSASRKMEIV